MTTGATRTATAKGTAIAAAAAAMAGLWSIGGAAQASELGTTEAIAATTIAHGAWLGGVGVAMASGEPGGLAMSAVCTHVALATTPIFLHEIDAIDAQGERRLDVAWGLYYTGLGITAAGWGLAGFTAESADAVPGLALMALGDAALIGSMSLAINEVLRAEAADGADGGRPPPTVVIPLVTTTF